MLSEALSIKSRLKRFFLTLLVSFGLIALGLFYTLSGVRANIDRIVEERLQQVVNNSHDSRDFGLLNSRLKVFSKTFYGDDAFLEMEGQALQNRFRVLQSRIEDVRTASLLLQLERAFDEYLRHCRWANTLLNWRTDQDDDINDLLVLIQEVIAEKTIEVALQGGDVHYLEQLILLISGYRETLLEIAKHNAEENKAKLLTGKVADLPPENQELVQLRLRMQTLTASEPPINKLGHHLLSRVQYYQYLMRLYQLEMIQLGEQGRLLDNLAGQILTAMDESDKQAAAAAISARQGIRSNIHLLLTLALSFLTLLAVAFWLSHRRLFKQHIQAPMELVSERLKAFQQGDHSSPMRLGRSDEWSEIESIFNRMLSDLRNSVSALRDSEQRYREIFTNSLEAIFRISISGEVLEVNPAAVKVFGYTSREEALLSISDMASQHYADPADRRAMIRQLYRDQKHHNFECRLLRKNKEPFWASVSNHLVRNEKGEILYIEGALQDISLRKAAQESLSKLQAYLQNIIDSMPSLLIGIDDGLKVTLWNRRVEQESGLAAQKAIGMPLAEAFQLLDPDCYLAKLRDTLATKQPARLLKLAGRRTTEKGQPRYFDMLIYPVLLKEGSGGMIHLDDISERVRLEEMMVRSEKMQSVGSLASGLAHEINNPLAAILQNVQVLTHRLSPELDKNRKVAEELGTSIELIAEYCDLRGCNKMLQAIATAGQRAAKIVENMQSFSRRGDSSFVSGSMADLLERTLELASSDYDMRYHFAFHKIRIVREYEAVPNVYCEPSQIQQVILSLLKNAAQAVSGHSDPPCISLRIFAAGKDQVCLQVEDNGPGMDSETVSKVFDPFYSTREVGSGTGLGLSIAYFIISQNHQGQLSVASEVGKGTCFDLVLKAVTC